MNRITHLKELRGSKLKELDALKIAAQKRAFTDDERKSFDGLANEVEGMNQDIARENRAADLSAADATKAEKADQIDPKIGLSKKELRQYSLTKVISALASGSQLDGVEREASIAEARRIGRDPQGVFIPAEVFFRAREARTNQVGVASDGGYLVGVDNMYDETVSLLRNQATVVGLGARVLSGLKNDVAIPRVLTGATAYWVSESGSITQTSATFGQIAMKPRRLGASVPYTKQLLAQSGIGVDSFISDDIMAAFAVELDRVAIAGAGATEPLGILNLASGDRSTSVTFSAAATWAKVISFETNVATANANTFGGKYAYLTTPATRGVWKGAVKVTNQASFLWEAGSNMVNGYDAVVSNQFPSGTANQVIFGNFGQVVYGEWVGADVTVDPLTSARTGQIIVTIQKFVDCVVRQGKAFAISSDSGAQ